MPATTTTISGEQRDALYELLRDRLSGIGDVWIAIEREDFASAARLGLEFGADFRLLEDLGWQEDDGREAVELTMPPKELAETLKRLREEAIAGLSDPPEVSEARELDEENEKRYRLALDTCAALLGALEERGEGRA